MFIITLLNALFIHQQGRGTCTTHNAEGWLQPNFGHCVDDEPWLLPQWPPADASSGPERGVRTRFLHRPALRNDEPNALAPNLDDVKVAEQEYLGPKWMKHESNPWFGIKVTIIAGAMKGLTGSVATVIRKSQSHSGLVLSIKVDGVYNPSMPSRTCDLDYNQVVESQ